MRLFPGKIFSEGVSTFKIYVSICMFKHTHNTQTHIHAIHTWHIHPHITETYTKTQRDRNREKKKKQDVSCVGFSIKPFYHLMEQKSASLLKGQQISAYASAKPFTKVVIKDLYKIKLLWNVPFYKNLIIFVLHWDLKHNFHDTAQLKAPLRGILSKP